MISLFTCLVDQCYIFVILLNVPYNKEFISDGQDKDNSLMYSDLLVL